MRVGKFLENLSSKVVLYLSAIIATGIILVNGIGIFTFQDLIKFDSIYQVIAIILVLLVIFISIKYLYKIKDEKKFIAALFLAGFIIRLLWIIVIKTEPVSDFKFMYDAAIDIVNKDYTSVLNNGYFNLWVYQLGFTGYLAILLKIFGNSLFMIKVINCIVTSLIPVIIYLSAKNIASKKSARIVSLGYCFYIGSIVTTSILTNQHMATLFFYLAIYFLLSNVNRFIKWAVVGVCLGLGEFFRPEGAIVILAILLYSIFKNISDIKSTFKNLSEAIASIIIVALIMKGLSLIFINMGVTEYNLVNRDPLWKFSCGLNPETRGTYSVDDDAFISSYGNNRKEANMILIKERLANPKELVKTMAYKGAVMWGANDTSLQFAFTENVPYTSLYNVVVKIEKIQYIIFIMIFTISTIVMIKRREKFIKSHLYLIIFLGYFLAHLLIEIQTRYRYFAIPIFFIISAYGIKYMFPRKE